MSRYHSGVFAVENTNVVIESLVRHGVAIEDARVCATIGCVEWSPQEDSFMNVSGICSRTHFSIANILLNSLTDGVSDFIPPPQMAPPGMAGKRIIAQTGLKVGYLYEKKTFDEVKQAFKEQFEYWIDWWFRFNCILEQYANPLMVVPLASAGSKSCMEKGVDYMLGGCKYNAYGSAVIGIGTAIDSLAAIKHFCFDTKKYSVQELYDACVKDMWLGHEVMRREFADADIYWGNDTESSNEIAKFVADVYTGKLNNLVGKRGKYAAGAYSAGAHQMQGEMTDATPNGRLAGVAVSDGGSASQGVDKNGPTAVINSVCALTPQNFYNGYQFVTKLSPSCVSGEEGIVKMKQLLEGFVDGGGGQIQYNIVSGEMLRDAQKNPDEYKNLVVRVAGYSAYFISLFDDVQEEIISRSEHSF
jgi:formate C-acetyltransferase